MCAQRRVCLLASVCALGIATLALGQEAPGSGDESDEPKTYYDLRRSNDRTTQLNAERYLALVKLQEWSDASGKSKVMAKYLEHDSDLGWVKLQATRVQDGKRVAKEITVPVEKLSKACQSRVRQIARLQEKLDPLLTGNDADSTTSADPGVPMMDEQGIDPRAAGYADPASAGPSVPTAPAPEPFQVDPLGFAEMDLGPTQVPMEPGAESPAAP